MVWVKPVALPASCYIDFVRRGGATCEAVAAVRAVSAWSWPPLSEAAARFNCSALRSLRGHRPPRNSRSAVSFSRA